MQWAMLTDFGSHTNMNGQQMRRRKRQLSDDPSSLPYVDLFSQSISKECCDYLTHQPSVSGLLGKAFFGSRRFLPEKYFLTATNSVFSLYPNTATSSSEFQLNDRYLQWKVTLNAPLELICSWGIEKYDIKGCTMMAFDPSLRKVYHGNCVNITMQTLEGFEFRHVTRLHALYAKFLLGGMVDELESRTKQHKD